MMKMRVKSAAFLLVLSTACSPHAGTDTGNPTSLGIKVVGLNSGVTLTEARIVLRDIDMDPLAACQAEAASPTSDFESGFTFAGPFVIDLLNDTSLPPAGKIPIPSGTYCEIGLDFNRLGKEEAPEGILSDDPIIGSALIVRGSRDDGTPFLVRLNEDDRFKLEGTSPDGFAIESVPGGTLLFISFDLSAWFEGVDLNAAVVSDGMIFIDHDDNAGLRSMIVENIKRSARLFKDLNGNGILDPEESDDTLVLGEGADEPD
jgi:hypothetical protein